MALNKDILKQQALLSTLSDEQIGVITTLSDNDENTVIGKKIGELHGQYDTDVLTVSGIPKNQGEKSYDYTKRVLAEYKAKATKADELAGKIATLDTKIAEYEEQIKSGKGNDVIVQKLKDAETLASKLQSQLETDKQNWEKEKGELSQKISSIQLDTEFEKINAGLKFKVGFDEEVQSVLISNAKQTILSKYKVEWIDNGKGGKALAFRNEAGDIIRNPENAQNPFTATELIKQQLKSVLDEGRKQTGTGTGETDKDKFIETADYANAKNKREFDDLVIKHLMQKGIAKGTPEFTEAQMKARTDFAGFSKLPM